MTAYKVYHSLTFDKELSKFDAYFQSRVDKIEDRLVINPYAGDPLNVKWFREKRIDNFRIYFIIYEDLKAVFMVAISGKKDQQRTINTIRLFFDLLREELERLIDKEKLDESDDIT